MNFFLVIQLVGMLFCFGRAQKTFNQTLLVEKGEKVMLPCLEAGTIVSEDGGEKYSEPVIWIRNGASILSVNDRLATLKNDLFSISQEGANFTFVIKKFSSSLSGLYTCRLAVTLDSITYNVTVKEPPLVLSIEGDTLIEIGDDLNLTCITSGFPAPNITWYRQKTTSSPRQSFHNEGNIFFENVIPGVSGIYTCVASYNSIEDSKSVTVVVFHGLKAEFESVYVEPPGEDTKFCCLLNKTKEIDWLKHGRNITFDDHITEETKKHKSCLVIHEVVFQDLGTYLCRTKNLRQLATVDLIGIPKRPQLVSSSNSSVTWKVVNSAFPILEYSIFVKPAGDARGSWRFVTNKKTASTDEEETKEFIIPFTFTLAPGRYDVKLEVSNRINVNQVINYDALDVDTELFNGANSFRTSVLFLWIAIVVMIWNS